MSSENIEIIPTSATSGVIYPSNHISSSMFNYTYSDIFRNSENFVRFFDPNDYIIFLNYIFQMNFKIV